MIKLFNTQSLKLSTKTVKRQIQMLLTAAGYRDWDVGIRFAGDKFVRTLNAEYRGKGKSTDILSFPFIKAIKPGVLPKPKSESDKDLGEIYISMKYVNRWCQDHNVDIHERLPVLYAHGICHLLGYDHEDNKDYITVSLFGSSCRYTPLIPARF
ncbi:hypothetical protein BGZ65_005438 [Modicella reniformis]|uniref:Uncharacterized protein n=1 Tax=Modicella reniformis TaxID=1440133 RepID=A0A9P6J5P7_9FUNG|nr:hypothetical protein BGZ65_005438 [Modicella reniformis]